MINPLLLCKDDIFVRFASSTNRSATTRSLPTASILGSVKFVHLSFCAGTKALYTFSMDTKFSAKTMTYDVGDSPPLTSSLHSRNSASSAQESAYLRQASILKWARFGLSGLIFALAVTIVGCTGHVLRTYNHTNLGPEWYLPLWPIDVDVKPTTGTLMPAAIVTVMSFIYLIFAAIPSVSRRSRSIFRTDSFQPRSRTLHQTLLFLLTSAISTLATLFAVIFYQTLLYQVDVNNRDTLQTWTCKLYRGAQSFQHDANQLQLPLSGDALVPAGFKRLCMESMVGQWMTVALLVLELVCCGVAVLGLMGEKKIKKHREMRYRGEKCESAFD